MEEHTYDGELSAFFEQVATETDVVRLEMVARTAKAAIVTAERGAVLPALRVGAALHRLKASTPGGYMAAVRRIFERSHRSATNYTRLFDEFSTSPERRIAILNAPSLRRALALLTPSRNASRTGSRRRPMGLLRDADALLQAFPGRERQVAALYEAAAALIGTENGEACLTVVEEAFGIIGADALQAAASQARAACSVVAEEPCRANEKVATGAQVTVAGVLIGIGSNEHVPVSPSDIAAHLEAAATAIRILDVPGAQTIGDPLALIFESVGKSGGPPTAEAMILAPFTAIKATAARSNEATVTDHMLRDLATCGVICSDDGEQISFVGVPHVTAIRSLQSLQIGPIAVPRPWTDSDCVAAAVRTLGAAGDLGGLSRALRHANWEEWPEAQSLRKCFTALMNALEVAPLHKDSGPGALPPQQQDIGTLTMGEEAQP